MAQLVRGSKDSELCAAVRCYSARDVACVECLILDAVQKVEGSASLAAALQVLVQLPPKCWQPLALGATAAAGQLQNPGTALEEAHQWMRGPQVYMHELPGLLQAPGWEAACTAARAGTSESMAGKPAGWAQLAGWQGSNQKRWTKQAGRLGETLLRHCLQSAKVPGALSAAAYLYSQPGGRRQRWHCDNAGEPGRRSVLLALEGGTKLHVRVRGREWDIFLEAGQFVVFDGDLEHAGGGYEAGNARLHGYIDGLPVGTDGEAVVFPVVDQAAPPVSEPARPVLRAGCIPPFFVFDRGL